MLVPNQYFDIKIIKTNIEHYRSLGYDVQLKDIITVPAEHLTKGSHQEVQVECDCCKKIISREFKNYLACRKDGYDTCSDCKTVKYKETIYNKYGVNNIMEVPEVRDKIKNTLMERYNVTHNSQIDGFKEKTKKTWLKKYGVEHPFYLDEIKEKRTLTNLERYGSSCPLLNEDILKKKQDTIFERYGVENVSQIEDVKEKKRQASLKKYGVECTLQSNEIKERVRKTMLNRYGYEYVWQVPELRIKALETMSKNGTTPTSTQQINIYDMIKKRYPNTELNYPFNKFSLDIFLLFNDIKIDIEYDGWYWHQDSQRDRRRDEYLKSQGFKILRIRSGNKLPTEEQLFEAIDKLIDTDRKYTEIILDDWKEGEITA